LKQQNFGGTFAVVTSFSVLFLEGSTHFMSLLPFS
jgi:hypothetical protein